MNYLGLRTNVQSAMGRDDIPTYVYELANATVNNEFRLLEMQAETTLTTTSESVALPSDFLEIESAYIDSGGSRTPLSPLTEQSQSFQRGASGRPYYYSVHDGELTLLPTPDASYDITVRYYARLADLTADTDTNDVLANYPGIYLYLALGHAAIWAKDDQSAAAYAQVYEGEKQRAVRSDTKRRLGPTLRPRMARTF